MSNDPKPCANCGGGYVVERTDDWTMWRVMCGRCGMSTDWHGSREDAFDVWNKRVDKPACKPEQADSRERLEADVNRYYAYTTSTLMWPASANTKTDWIQVPKDKVLEWLDRQAAITKNECREEHRQRLSELHDLLDKAARERNNLQARVDHLSYDAKKWADAANEQRLVAMEQADKAQKLTVENDRLRHQADELVCKIGEITDATGELLRKQPYSFNPGDVVGSLKTVGKYIEKLTIELDAYKTFWESSK